MNKINLLLTTANGNLSNSKKIIEKGIKIVEGYTFAKLKIDWDIDALMTNRLYNMIIPEDGVGDRTHTNDFIEFALDEEKATKNLMSVKLFLHEYQQPHTELAFLAYRTRQEHTAAHPSS